MWVSIAMDYYWGWFFLLFCRFFLGSSYTKSITCSGSSSLRTANLFFSVMLDVWVLFIFLLSLSIGIPFLLFLLLLVGLVYWMSCDARLFSPIRVVGILCWGYPSLSVFYLGQWLLLLSQRFKLIVEWVIVCIPLGISLFNYYITMLERRTRTGRERDERTRTSAFSAVWTLVENIVLLSEFWASWF